MAKDILLDEDGDLKIVNGDLVVAESDEQNLEHLLMLNTGHIKDNPLAGCNLYRLVNGRLNPQEVVRDVKIQLKADNWIKEKVSFDGQNMNATAGRKDE